MNMNDILDSRDATKHTTKLEFIRMMEYYSCTPTVYPTDIFLHRGHEESVQIKQYPDMTIEADQWSTFIVQQREHNRDIKSD